MVRCLNLDIVTPEGGLPYGKCPLMNNGNNINEFLAIKAGISKIQNTGIVAPNEDCPFFNRDIDQSLCPCYE